jgi:hemolysin activation/secretion protein
VRGKYGWSDSDDKNLYELGGMDGLRGYDRKTIRGAQAVLGSVEYRFPIIRDRQWDFVDNTFTITGISGVIFLDAGHSWYDDYSDGDWKTDAGVGLRAPVAIASFLEQTMLRLDVAHAIDEPDASTRVWFGVNQAF